MAEDARLADAWHTLWDQAHGLSVLELVAIGFGLARLTLMARRLRDLQRDVTALRSLLTALYSLQSERHDAATGGLDGLGPLTRAWVERVQKEGRLQDVSKTPAGDGCGGT